VFTADPAKSAPMAAATGDKKTDPANDKK
jgi:hypothetical protein